VVSKLGFWESLGSELLLVYECGHVTIFKPENSYHEIPISIECQDCSQGNPAQYSDDIPEVRSMLQPYIESFDHSLRVFHIVCCKMDGFFAEVVRYQREVVRDQEAEKFYYNIQEQFLALDHDVVTSGQIFKESYVRGLSEHYSEMNIRKQQYERAIENANSDSRSLPITDVMNETSTFNPNNLLCFRRIGSSAKSFLVWIRAFQDVSVKLFQMQAAGMKPGNYTSMS